MIRRIMPAGRATENGGVGARPTPQQKLIQTSQKFGNTGIKNMQGTTYVVYDFLPLPAGQISQGTELRFFENAGSRSFPMTNMLEGRLPVGEAMVAERVWFTIITIGTGETTDGDILDVFTFDSYAFAAAYKCDYYMQIANNIVIKPSPLIKMNPAFNWRSWSDINNVIHLDTDITIQPQIDFAFCLKMPQMEAPTTTGFDAYIGCHIEGVGAAMNPRANY